MHQRVFAFGLAASCLLSLVFGSPMSEVEDASARDLAYAQCEKHPLGATPGEMPACSQARIIEDNLCKISNVDDAEDLLHHVQCICNTNFFEVKNDCHSCLKEHNGLTEDEHIFWSYITTMAEEAFCREDSPLVPFYRFWLNLVNSTPMELAHAMNEIVNATAEAFAEPDAMENVAKTLDCPEHPSDATSTSDALGAALFSDEDDYDEGDFDEDNVDEHDVDDVDDISYGRSDFVKGDFDEDSDEDDSDTLPSSVPTFSSDPKHTAVSMQAYHLPIDTDNTHMLHISEYEAVHLQEELDDNNAQQKLEKALSEYRDGAAAALVDRDATLAILAVGKEFEGESGDRFRQSYRYSQDGVTVTVVIEGEGSHKGHIFHEGQVVEDPNGATVNSGASLLILMGCALLAVLSVGI